MRVEFKNNIIRIGVLRKPSPFPGMDPYLEDQQWEDFHTTFNTVIRETLTPSVKPRYIVRVER